MCPKWSIWICVRVRLCAKLCPVSCASYNKVNPQYKYYVFRCALSFIRNVQAKIRSVFPSSALLFRPNSSSTVLFYWDRACHSFHIFFSLLLLSLRIHEMWAVCDVCRATWHSYGDLLRATTAPPKHTPSRVSDVLITWNADYLLRIAYTYKIYVILLLPMSDKQKKGY